jgi:hypothetical protein
MLCILGVYSHPSAGIVKKDEDMFFVGEIGTLCELSDALLQQCLCGNLSWKMTGDMRQVTLYHSLVGFIM